MCILCIADGPQDAATEIVNDDVTANLLLSIQ